jgi:hypothetical protein
MKHLIILPEGWRCSLEDCPPGFFVTPDGSLCLKTEYRNEAGDMQVYNGAGESYHGPKEDVQPVKAIWDYIEY